jgi:hypothetical protein
MKVTLNVLENRGPDADKHWPGYMFGGRVRTSTLVLIVAFFATWWTYNTYRPVPTPPVAPQVVPPGYVPDPNYTWVPRTRVQEPTYNTPTTTVTTTTPPPPTTSPTTTTPPPLIPPFVLPPPFGPGPTTPAPSTPTPPPGPTPAPAPAPAPGFPGLPGLPG